MKGRKPKPAELKVLQGNPGKRALPEVPKVPRRTPPRPRTLDAEGRKAWDRLVRLLEPTGMMATCDAVALELLADTYALWWQARQIIREQGLTYAVTTASGTVHRRRPEVEIESDSWKRLRAMLVEFGLTPSARTRTGTTPPDGADEKDPDASFLFGTR